MVGWLVFGPVLFCFSKDLLQFKTPKTVLSHKTFRALSWNFQPALSMTVPQLPEL